MFKCIARYRNSEEWKDVTWSQFPFHTSTRQEMEQYATIAGQLFPHIEYKVEEIKNEV